MLKSEKKVQKAVFFLDQLDNLLGSECFAAVWAELVGKRGQASEAGAMAAVEDTLFSLVVVVFFQADVALVSIFLRCF